MTGLGYTEMVIFGVLALMLFGSKLPEVARSLGGTYRELRKNMNEFQREFQSIDRPDPSPPVRYTEDEDNSETVTTAARFTPPKSDDSPSA